MQVFSGVRAMGVARGYPLLASVWVYIQWPFVLNICLGMIYIRSPRVLFEIDWCLFQWGRLGEVAEGGFMFLIFASSVIFESLQSPAIPSRLGSSAHFDGDSVVFDVAILRSGLHLLHFVAL